MPPFSYFEATPLLTIVATPIGNLKDITLRALEVLQSVDCILAEDTRHTKQLLNHFEIQTPLKALHKFNESSALDSVIDELKLGKTFALVSDAGTPLLSDPGEELIQACYTHDIAVTACPGPSSVINALVLSGLKTHPFQFVGFLPRAQGELEKTLLSIANYLGTSIAFESPERVIDTLQIAFSLQLPLKITLLREMTKRFEERQTGSAAELLARLAENPPRGEYVILFQPIPGPLDAEPLPLKEVENELVKGMRLKEACALVAARHNLSSRALYQAMITAPK